MNVLVTGASGVLGRRVCDLLVARAHAVHAATRRGTDIPELVTPVWMDLETGAGVPDGVDGVDAIVHCATDARRHRRVDREGTRVLVETARRAGSPHLVYPSIVGVDLAPLRYHRSKVAAEQTVTGSGLPWSILRATRFHHFVWKLMSRLSRPPVMVVPAGLRFQPIDPTVVASKLVDLVERGPAGRVPDLGGPRAYEAKALAGSYLAATGTRRWIVALNQPGIAGAALRAGANLTPNRVEEGMTWNDFVAERMAEV